MLWDFRSFTREDFFTLTGSLDGGRLVVMEIPAQPRGAFLLDGSTGELLKTYYDKDTARARFQWQFPRTAECSL